MIGLNRHNDRIEELIKNADIAPIISRTKEGKIDDEFVEFKEYGFGLHFISGTLASVRFYSARTGTDYAEYRYPLPIGVRFGQSESEIQACLGQPHAKGGGGVSGFFGPVPTWFKYKLDKNTVHLEFTLDGTGLQALTVMNYE
jgi:hypothetical protein